MWQDFKNYYHLAQALIAAIYFKFPSKKLTVIGVTGTDGKTTTVNMIYHILNENGYKASMISSVNAQIGSKKFNTGLHVTTPSSFNIQKYLAKAQKEGSKYFVLESTSHGLDQNRLAFIDFKIAVITNISHEHLDYHKTWENYAKSKLKLFNAAEKSVLNADDKSYGFLNPKIEGSISTYGKNQKSDFNFNNFKTSLSLNGQFNMYNALAASAAASLLGVSKAKIISSLKTFKNVTGRMEQINAGQKFSLFIDFAHTPNSIEKALEALGEKNKEGSKIISVFGAAGERDKMKRPMMGSAASKFSDLIVLTTEDPRSENPDEICREIEKGIKGKKKNLDYFIITDRKEAITFAVKKAGDNDTVVLFGKGHEKSMTIGKTELPWNEHKEAIEAIKNKNNAK